VRLVLPLGEKQLLGLINGLIYDLVSSQNL
jgi:hypothetical protein